MCGGNATCIDQVGSYECVCNPGFERDGELCRGMMKCHIIKYIV